MESRPSLIDPPDSCRLMRSGARAGAKSAKGQKPNPLLAALCQLSPEADILIKCRCPGAAGIRMQIMPENLVRNVSTKWQVSMGRGDHFWKKYFEGLGNADTAGSHPQSSREIFLKRR